LRTLLRQSVLERDILLSGGKKKKRKIEGITFLVILPRENSTYLADIRVPVLTYTMSCFDFKMRNPKTKVKLKIFKRLQQRLRDYRHPVYESAYSEHVPQGFYTL